jgi:hypothetical protein
MFTFMVTTTTLAGRCGLGHQPANEECALGPVETVGRHHVGAIPQDQAVFCQRLCDGIHRGDHPMVVGRQEAD